MTHKSIMYTVSLFTETSLLFFSANCMKSDINMDYLSTFKERLGEPLTDTVGISQNGKLNYCIFYRMENRATVYFTEWQTNYFLLGFSKI